MIADLLPYWCLGVFVVVMMLVGGYRIARSKANLAPQAMPEVSPYRNITAQQLAATVQKQVESMATDELTATITREIQAKYQRAAEADKYQHALEAIATIGHNETAQRIARQALGKE